MKTYTIVTVGENGDPEVLDEWGLDLWATTDRAEELFKKQGVRPSRAEEVELAALDDLTREVVGAITLGFSKGDDGISYTFSVVVEPSHRRQGIARALVKDIQKIAKEDAEARVVEEYAHFRVWVINPVMALLLEDLGFDTEGSEWSPDNPHMYKDI